MSEQPLAFLNDRFLPYRDAAIALHDAGFVQGVTVSEQLRTFGGRLFRLEEHLQRLEQSLMMVGIHSPHSSARLAEIARQLIEHNLPLAGPAGDLGLAILLTPGPYAAFAPPDSSRTPTVCLHTYRLAFRLWAEKFRIGQALVTTSVMQVPSECWPTALKCRSRMHYYLADREAQRIEAGARALMLDQQGCVTEASTANLVIFRTTEGLISPPLRKILPGISVAVLEELAQTIAISFTYRDLTLQDLIDADEAFLTSTSPCILPVSRVNGHPLRGGVPGPMYARLLAAWNKLVGLDIAEQARQGASS
jgi:branched-subunit amino acid aminotransferase/4-amino-4-deoxychorismate lyase